MKFIFRDWSGKYHAKSSKATSCRYSYEMISRAEKFVIRDYFTNKIINKFSIPDSWSFLRYEE